MYPHTHVLYALLLSFVRKWGYICVQCITIPICCHEY